MKSESMRKLRNSVKRPYSLSLPKVKLKAAMVLGVSGNKAEKTKSLNNFSKKSFKSDLFCWTTFKNCSIN